MADSTDPTTGDKGTSNTRFALVASFDAAGSLQITGPGLSDNTLIVEAGTQISVTISDPPDNHIYGEQIVPGGERALCWGRVADKGLAKTKISVEREAITNITYVVSSGDTSKVKYGPVITVKPKG